MAGDPFSSHPYPALKEIVSKVHYCDVCDKDMRNSDKVAHERGKKHAEKVAEMNKPDLNEWSFSGGSKADSKGCHNCGGDHLARHCTAPRKDTRECHHCGKVGHAKADCPDKPRQTCHNCGEEGHRKTECTNERLITCRNCLLTGHVARDCPEPPNPANFKCNNCENMGHKAKDCPQPKDWSKVRCNNCQQYGHTVKRCTNEPAAVDTAGWNNDAVAATPSEPWTGNQADGPADRSWDDTISANEAPTNESWDDTLIAAEETATTTDSFAKESASATGAPMW